MKCRRTHKLVSYYGKMQFALKLKLICVIFTAFFLPGMHNKILPDFVSLSVPHWIDNTASNELKHLSTSCE